MNTNGSLEAFTNSVSSASTASPSGSKESHSAAKPQLIKSEPRGARGTRGERRGIEYLFFQPPVFPVLPVVHSLRIRNHENRSLPTRFETRRLRSQLIQSGRRSETRR